MEKRAPACKSALLLTQKLRSTTAHNSIAASGYPSLRCSKLRSQPISKSVKAEVEKWELEGYD
jgi:hypothetical protein